MTQEEPEWFAGIDWASERHQVCLLDRAGKVLGERSFAHGGAGLAELCDWLLAKTGVTPERVAVAIEVPHGPVVEALLERGFLVHAINPKQLDRFRDRFTVAGAKTTAAMRTCSAMPCAPTEHACASSTATRPR